MMRTKLFALVAGGLAAVGGWANGPTANAAPADEPRTPVKLAVGTGSDQAQIHQVDHRRRHRNRGYYGRGWNRRGSSWGVNIGIGSPYYGYGGYYGNYYYPRYRYYSYPYGYGYTYPSYGYGYGYYPYGSAYYYSW